jgi:hypothetical protein
METAFLFRLAWISEDIARGYAAGLAVGGFEDLIREST